MPPLRASSAAVAALLLAAASGGCGTPDATTVEGHRIALRMEEFRYVPQALKASPGRLEIVARNRGRLAHNVTVYRRGEIAGAPSVKPGGSTRVRFRARRGTYRFECSISNHDDLGMYGTLVVR